MKVIGLTGGIGAGKTQILNYLNDKYGASICQADEVAKNFRKKGLRYMMRSLHILEKRFWTKRARSTEVNWQISFLRMKKN